MKWIYILIFFIQLCSLKLHSQTKIAPELGVNHQYQFYLNNYNYPEIDTIRVPSLFIGLTSTIPISKRLYFGIRVNYVFRMNKSINGRNIVPTKIEFINNEMNCHSEILYNIGYSFKLGSSIGLIHKLNSRFTEVGDFNINRSRPVTPKYLLTGSLLLHYDIDKIGINVRYFYVLTDTQTIVHFDNITSAKSGFALGISYNLFST